jgi:quercetin dioxygenase-like cupin family protein
MNTVSPQEVIRVGQIEIRYLLEGSQTNGSLALFEATIPPNARVPAPHRHVTYDETICEIAGTCTFLVERQELALAPGHALFIPRGAVHQFVNRSAEPVRFLATITPGVLDPSFFREIGAIVNAGGPPDLRAIAEVMRKHGLEHVQSP